MDSKASRLKELAALFLKLGVIGFGGPAVHIAMMEEEVVRKRKWFTQQYFLDLVGATNLIPGPNSTEMTMHCGLERAGWKGLLVAGLCFILPAVLITGVFAWAYQRYGKLPEVEPFIYGIKPAVIAVVVSLMISLGRKALKSVELAMLGILAAALGFFDYNEVFILFGTGLAGILIFLIRNAGKGPFLFTSLLLSVQGLPYPWKLFWIFLKIGAILYGSGYVLFAFLDSELVGRGLLTRQELIDAVAVGQITPGPVFSAATFIGWQVAGLPGAVAATIGVFLPSFLFVALLNPLVSRLRRSKVMSAFLDAVNIASVALILLVCWKMAQSAVSDWRTIVIAILALVISVVFKKLNSVFIVFGGGVLGYGLSLL